MKPLSVLSACLHSDLLVLIPKMHKREREKLSILCSVALETQTCNLMEWANALPHESLEIDYRYRWIERFMNATTIDEDFCMSQLMAQKVEKMVLNKEEIIISLDQTDIKNRFGVLMLSIRVGNRGLPLFWRVRETCGNIGTSEQLELIDLLSNFLPKGAKVLFLADKFFGTTSILEACQKNGWSYRIRIKKNNCINNIKDIYATRDLKNLENYGVEQAELFQKGIITNIGYLHEEGYENPWIIAMDGKPTRENILQYSQRWGIESMFSDLKSRGFGLEDTNLKSAKRIARLILILSVALYCAVHVGIQIQNSKKNTNL